MAQNVVQTHKVALINLGEGLPLNLVKLAKKLNRIQKTFEFEIRGVITSKVAGEPDIDDLWYGLRKLFGTLSSVHPLDDFDFVIAVTNFRITDETKLEEGEKDYFSLSDLNKFSIISINERVYGFSSKLKTVYQFTAFQIITELLINMSKRDLIHIIANGCLFDDCVDRSRFKSVISKSGFICEECKENLKERNISDEVIADAQKILNYCKKDDILTLLGSTIMHPLASLIIGATLGWLSQFFIAAKFYPFVLSFTFLVLLVIFLSVKYPDKFTNGV